MERNTIVKYKNKEILYIDHRGLREQALLNNVKAAFQMIKDYKGQEVLTLGDWRDTSATQEIMDYLKSTEVIEINKKTKKTVF